MVVIELKDRWEDGGREGGREGGWWCEAWMD